MSNMYNKPITQRVAFARGKKPSALKQTDTTVLKTEEIPVVKNKVSVDLPDTTETIIKPGKVEASKERCGIEVPMSDPRCVAFFKMSEEEIKASEIKQGLREPDTEETVVTPGGKGTAERPQYMYDYGDSMPSYMQRKVYRGLKVGERQQKKALTFQLKAGAITKEEYKQGLADAALQRANASKAFAETQAEAARQGQMFGKTGTTRIGTFNPNVRVSGKEGTVGRQTTLVDKSGPSQAIENQKRLQDEAKNQAAVNAAENQRKAEQRQDQEDVADKNVKIPAEMKVGPLKMKSSFKMGGYGSKTYKK